MTPISAVKSHLKQNPNHQAHTIQKTRVSLLWKVVQALLWKVVQALTMEVMGFASDVVGIAGVDCYSC